MEFGDYKRSKLTVSFNDTRKDLKSGEGQKGKAYQ